MRKFAFLQVRDVAVHARCTARVAVQSVLRVAGQDTCNTAGLQGTGSPKTCQFASADSKVGLVLLCRVTQHYQMHTQSALTKAHCDVCHIQKSR